MASELILVVEDNEKNRKLVRDVLHVTGYQTIETETAEEGFNLALEKSPALILMDIQLPGMDGITALKRLRADPTTKTIPVIAITASAMTYNRKAMLAEGFDGYQSKPISVKDFLQEVRRVLDFRRIRGRFHKPFSFWWLPDAQNAAQHRVIGVILSSPYRPATGTSYH